MLSPGTKVRIPAKGFDPDIVGIVVEDTGLITKVNRDPAGLLPLDLAIVEVSSKLVEVC